MQRNVGARLEYSDLDFTPHDGRRYELLDGELVVTPSPSPLHQWASKRLQRQLEAYFEEERALGEVFNAPIDVILTKHDVVVPDIVVVTDLQLVSRRGIEGAPVLVVEVLSPSTRRTDRKIKSLRYARLGVPHYWLLDPDEKRLECFRLGNAGYEPIAEAAGGQTLVHPDWDGLVIDLRPLWRE